MQKQFFKCLILCAVLVLGCTQLVFAGNSTYYSKCTVTANSTGYGTVYASASSTKGSSTSATQNSSASSAPTHTYYIFADSKPGYYFSSWSGSGATVASSSTANTTATVKASSTDKNSPTTGTCTATFAAVGISSASPAAVAINLNNPDADADYSGSVAFSTSGADASNDFKTPAFSGTGIGTYTVGDWSYAGNTVTVPYTFNAGGSYFNGTKTLTLTSAGGENSREVTFTITRPNIVISGGDAGVHLLPSAPTADAVGSATFNVQYTNGASEFTADFSNIVGGGAWSVTSIDYAKGTEGKGVITVNYTMNPSGAIGDHSADLTLTASTAGGATFTVTPTAEAEAVKDYDVEVFDKDGNSIFTGAWATGVTKVNANEGSTIQLARNIDLGTLTAHGATFTKTTTLDLNGKTLSATSVSGKYLIYLNTSGKTLTIKDSKNGGTISAVGSANTTLYSVYINQGNLVLNSGKIYVENQLPYASGTTSVAVRALQLSANVNFTMNGGEITGEAGNSAYGIRHEGGATATGKVIINDGVINANCKRQYAYGIYELGKLEVHGGTINAKTYTSTGTSEAYGIFLSGGANMTASKEYGAELTMDGGTVNAQSQTSGAYGVYVGGSVTIFKNDDNTTYSHERARAYPAVAYISGGTINAFSTTSSAYALRVMNSVKTEDETISTTVVKPTIVTGGTFNAQATTSSAYGIMADAQSSWGYGTISFGVVEVSNVEVTATTGTSSAYGAYVNTNGKIFDNGNTKMNYHNTYKVAGEWVAAGKMIIHSGTFKGIAGTSTAAGVGVATRAAVRVGKTSDNIKYAYGELNIDGGTFSGKTTTTNAYGVVSGGNTTITGGTFSAEATTSDAFGVYTTSGKTTISNVPVTVVARGKNSSNNGSAYGLLASCSVADYTGIAHPSEIVANNLTVNVTTTTGANARGVCVSTTQRTLTDATFNALSAAYQATYINMYIRGEWATAGKATINGGTYTVNSATTYAYGARVENASITASGNTVATGELEINGGTFTAKTNGTTYAYGVYAGGKTTIDGATFNVQPTTSNAYGLYVYDKKTTVSNSTFNVTATAAAYGAYLDAQISSTYGYLYESELESSDNTFDVKATSGNTAQAVTLVANKRNIASGTFAGDYVAASKATINSGTYKATASGTTAYAIVVPATVTQGSLSATAHCEVNGGKFMASATSTFADVNAASPEGALVLKGGYYKTKTNLAKYKTNETTIWDLTDGEEYDQGYRYLISEDRPLGVAVCRIGSIYFHTLETALLYTQENSGSNHTIIMICDYILPAGNYTLPSNATLLIPWKADQTSAKGSSVERQNDNNVLTPSVFRKLTFASGVKMTVEGTVEVGGVQNCYNNVGVGVPIKTYGQLVMEEGASITLVSGAKLMAWGYVTGKGTIDARRGSYCYEMFQILDFRGGTCTYKMDNNSYKYFPLNQYYIQNIEVPITFHPGAKEITSTAVINAACDNVQIIGTDGETALFTMDNEDDSEDTWVRKSYDPVRDRQIYEINSAAKLNAMTIKLSSYTFTSSSYILPITNNIDIHLLSGQMEITQDVSFLCGSTLEIDKEATGKINSGKSVFFYDTEDWVNYAYSNVPIQPVKYSPSWPNGKCPRSGQPASSILNIHGTLEVSGGLYTTAHGSNIISTNSDAGTIVFKSTAPSSNKTIYECNNTSPSYTAVSCVPALLRNGDNSTVSTSGTPAGKSYCYINDRWTMFTTDGCFVYDNYGVYYAKPHDYVALFSNTEDANHLYYSQDKSRMFILMNDCQWWEVTPYDDIYYCADNDTYYFYNEDDDEWQVKTLTVTWKNFDGTTIGDPYTNVAYGSTPKYLGTNPKRAMDDYYTYDFIGWLPTPSAITSDAVYVAQYEQNDRMYQIIFKDKSGTTIETDYYAWGSMPICEKEPAGVGTTLEWSPALATVSGAQIYQLRDKQVKSEYSVIFKNYNGDELQSGYVHAGETPVYSGETPAKPALKEYVFTFNGWDKAIVPATEDVIYTATFVQSYGTHTIRFYGEDGTSLLQELQVTHGDVPVYTATLPTKPHENSEGYYYELVWSPLVSAAIADQDYTATFVERVNTLRTIVEAGEHGTISVLNNTTSTTIATDVTRSSETYDCYTSLTITATPEIGYHFVRWSDGNISASRDITVTQSATYTAVFEPDFGEPMDIVDWTPTSVTINMNGYKPSATPWSVEIGSATKVAGDRNSDRTLTFTDLTLAANSFLTITAYGDAATDSKRSYIVPNIYDNGWTLGGTALNENSVILVRSGVLTLSANTHVDKVIVSTGATLVINSGVTLECNKLILRTKAFEQSASLTNKGTLICSNVYYTRIVADKSQYLPFALPFAFNTNDVTLSLGTAPYGSQWILRSYSESKRATTGPGNNWETQPAGDVAACTGFEMFSNSAFYREYYFPVTISDKTTVAVSHTAGSSDTDLGWNNICSPLTSILDITNPAEGIMISELQSDGTYRQQLATSIYPAAAFFYQASATGSLTFAPTMTVPAAVAARRASAQEHSDAQVQWMNIQVEDATGLDDQTNVFSHPDKYSMAYEAGKDLEKLSLTGARPLIYSVLPCGNLAFAAIPDSIAETRIPLTVYAPHAEQLTISLADNDYLSRVENVYLVDELLGSATDLLSSDFQFEAEQGATEGRFYIRVIFRSPENTETPDALDNINTINNQVQKVYIGGHIYILRDGAAYDMTGRKTVIR